MNLKLKIMNYKHSKIVQLTKKMSLKGGVCTPTLLDQSKYVWKNWRDR